MHRNPTVRLNRYEIAYSSPKGLADDSGKFPVVRISMCLAPSNVHRLKGMIGTAMDGPKNVCSPQLNLTSFPLHGFDIRVSWMNESSSAFSPLQKRRPEVTMVHRQYDHVLVPQSPTLARSKRRRLSRQSRSTAVIIQSRIGKCLEI